MALTFHFLVLALSLVSIASSLECRKNFVGEFQLLEDEKVVNPGAFACMRITKPDQTTVHITYLNDDADGRKVCQISDDGTPKDKRVYIRSQVQTGTMCKYVCKDSEGLYSCDTATTPVQNACTCHVAKPRLLIHPVDSISGQSDEEEEEDGCEDKPEGYQFADPVSCSSMTGDITKLRVNYLDDKLKRCSAKVSKQKETKYTEAPNEVNLQGCLYVCKKAGPRCIGEVEHGKCDCESPGLRKRLVPMDNIGVRDLLTQKRCIPGECGPCAACNDETGHCKLHQNAHEGNFCDCGEVCPQRDLRAPEHKGGKILCRPNIAIECMKKPGWLTSLFDSNAPGTRYANLCTSGHVDATDTCSCAPGHTEQPGPFSGVYCIKSR